jgi:hypothetical protein
MAKKCIGMRVDTGDRCNRSASSGSDFCFAHRPQEGDQMILYVDEDVYHCPHDGQELLYVPIKKSHRCRSCRGVLLSSKAIDPQIVEKILQLREIESKQEVCPSCVDGANLSIHEVEYIYSTGGTFSSTLYGVSNIWICDDCGSLWVPGVKWGAFKSSTAGPNLLFGYQWGEIEHSTWLDNQVKWREKRLEKEAQKELRLAKKRLKWCNHVDSSSGLQCRTYKSQKSIHDQDYCYKHQPKR